MTYVLNWLGQPIFTSKNPIEVHQVALANGLAINAWGCLFTLIPGATIRKVRIH
jgi:hypothetical protein